MERILNSLGDIPLGFGGASISGEGAGYGFGDISKDNAIALLNYAFDRGVRLFDTAPIYGFGESERRIGEAFKSNRDEVFIISKCGVSWHPSMRVNMTNDPKTSLEMLHASLKRLNTDYIDHYMIHWPDESVDIRKTMEVLAKAKLQGKIKSIGLCNTFEEDYMKAREVDEITSLQSELNLFSRESLEGPVSIAKRNNISFMSWGTLDKGILTGRVNSKRKFDKSDCRSWAPWWKAIDKDSRYQRVEKLKEILKDYQLSTLELALAFNLSFDNVDKLLCGGRSIEQWDDLISAAKKNIDKNTLSEILEKFDEN
ncbi:putative aldo/keto reductase [Halobacteriovorax marinus SJ]|uniref:Aldo/keto reductase n=1 Tax=Halobacteriovorax marinus (strain ATCC BAA-682 / DSM 15412 / SJ) TaxID=862908 RepID=E1WXW6_HALMS|nr:aldo/keto reductase [Halobacteriovorax marinus]CBW25923.1 putative aldo/keto reductase [Halobacteriovorax marinus SJ]